MMGPKKGVAKKARGKQALDEPELPEYMAIGSSDSENESGSEGSEGEVDDNDDSVEKPEKPEVDPKTMKKAKQQIAKAATSGDRGVIYLGNIPFGFYEEEMKAFFNQFGTVSRLRMSRSKKTGRSRGYAFIEFEHREVAEIVAETMNNYLMFNRLLKCQVILPERVHEETFKNAHRAFRHMDWRKFEQRQHNKARNEEQTEKVVKRLVKNEKKTRAKLEKLGIEYDFPGYEANKKTSAVVAGQPTTAKSVPQPTPKTSAKSPASTKPACSKVESKSAAKATPSQSKQQTREKATPKPEPTPAGGKRKAQNAPTSTGKKQKKAN